MLIAMVSQGLLSVIAILAVRMAHDTPPDIDGVPARPEDVRALRALCYVVAILMLAVSVALTYLA